MAVSAFEWMDIMMPGIHKGVGVKQHFRSAGHYEGGDHGLWRLHE